MATLKVNADTGIIKSMCVTERDLLAARMSATPITENNLRSGLRKYYDEAEDVTYTYKDKKGVEQFEVIKDNNRSRIAGSKVTKAQLSRSSSHSAPSIKTLETKQVTMRDGSVKEIVVPKNG